MNIVSGTAVYLRNTGSPDITQDALERQAAAFAKRAKAMKLGWVAIGGVWQDDRGGVVKSAFMNSPRECHAYAKALKDVGILPYVWGYPWLGAESKFIVGMAECAGDDGLHLLDPELGANPSRGVDSRRMGKANTSASLIVSGLRDSSAKVIGLSTFGGVPPWFPLDAYLAAGVDFAGGQTYTDDANIDTSIASFVKRIARAGSKAQVVPNFGLYSRDTLAEKKVRAKTAVELRKHLDEFINEGENVKACIGWAENFLNPSLEKVLADFAPRLV